MSLNLPAAFSAVMAAVREHQVHPGVELRANLEELRDFFESTSHRCHLEEVAFVRELTNETVHVPQGCLLGGL